jgi:hypothetical protein
MMLSKLVLKPELCVIVFVGLGQEHAGWVWSLKVYWTAP